MRKPTTSGLRLPHPHLSPLVEFLAFLEKESPRGQVLISTGFIEEQLKDTLLAFMRKNREALELVDGANAPLGTLSARISACFVLGLISDDEHHDLDLVRRIRNQFAHDIETTFSTPGIVSRCGLLRLKAQDYTSTDGQKIIVAAQGQFQTAAVALISRFLNRPYYIRRTPRPEINWPL